MRDLNVVRVLFTEYSSVLIPDARNEVPSAEGHLLSLRFHNYLNSLEREITAGASLFLPLS